MTPRRNYPADFDELWRWAPRDEYKAACYRMLQEMPAATSPTLEEMLRCWKRAWVMCWNYTEARFRPSPKTWFELERWDDRPTSTAWEALPRPDQDRLLYEAGCMEPSEAEAYEKRQRETERWRERVRESLK